MNTAGAGYFIAPITNAWGTSNQIVERSGCLNLAQSVPNADGTYTFVVSKHDPGVHNWLDPSDMGDGILTLRWAEFPGGAPSDELSAKSRVVSLSSLDEALPAETKKVGPGERKSLMEARAKAYRRRLPEAGGNPQIGR